MSGKDDRNMIESHQTRVTRCGGKKWHLTVILRQGLVAANDLVEVCVHQLIHDVHVVEILPRGRSDDVTDSNDILMVHMAQELDFSEGSLGIDPVVEGVANLLDGNLFPCFGIHSRAVQTPATSEYTKSTAKKRLRVVLSRAIQKVKGHDGPL